ncbi:hypothetical protein BRC84_06080 [Halobacteriales archaeon QS_1_68_44]|nr:MAG: hypothetical protein BRC84_06080 [Halobacteriales archaeon QS_1_68_44]
MLDPSRRRVLQLGVGALVATAGCSDETTGDGPPEEYVYVEDPQWVSVRAGGTEPVVSHPDEEEKESRVDWTLLLSESSASELTFRREPDGVEAARSFVDGTRFDEETLFVYQTTVRQCYTKELPYLSREPSKRVPRPGFCTRLRPPDVACSVDAEDTEVHFVRLPVGLEDRPRSYGFDSGGDCDPRQGPLTDDRGDGE